MPTKSRVLARFVSLKTPKPQTGLELTERESHHELEESSSNGLIIVALLGSQLSCWSFRSCPGFRVYKVLAFVA